MQAVLAASDSSGIGTLLLVAAALYFIPTIVAFARGHHNAASVLVVNLFLGWSLIGWVVAMAMAVSGKRA